MTTELSLQTKTQDVICEAVGASGRMTLNRPTKMNALNDAMREAMCIAMEAWETDINIYAVITQGVNDGVLCAGGDLKEMVAHIENGGDTGAEALRFEYRHNWRIETYTKPHVALINGMVMGSGAGLTSFVTHVAAGPDYQFAMPECAIGLFPDVGVMSKLARMPDHIGLYLALTGTRINRADGYELGLVTHCLQPEQFDAVRDGLARADTVDPIIDGLHAEPSEPGSVLADRERIAAAFAAPSIQDIYEGLKSKASNTGVDTDWAQQTLATLDDQCPLSLAVTFRHYHEATRKSVRDVLRTDMRLATRMIADPNFAEGVRALLIDKDKSPKWQPATVHEIDDAHVDRFFEGLGEKELDLPIREFG